VIRRSFQPTGGFPCWGFLVIAIAQISVDNFVIKRVVQTPPQRRMDTVTNVNSLLQQKNLYESIACEVFLRVLLQIAAKVPAWVCIRLPVENVALHADREAA
jgi:hypothetical protein